MLQQIYRGSKCLEIMKTIPAWTILDANVLISAVEQMLRFSCILSKNILVAIAA